MFRFIFALVLFFFFVGCATNDDMGVVTPEIQSKVAATSTGEPIYSTSMAMRLAELALREEGVSYSERNMMVSFCDNVYTVTFEKKPDDIKGCDFTVDIDANTSKILKVVTKR
jgi:adenine C2-methylase RlmN of 23S rRNA A2503 and tRNA A37